MPKDLHLVVCVEEIPGESVVLGQKYAVKVRGNYAVLRPVHLLYGTLMRLDVFNAAVERGQLQAPTKGQYVLKLTPATGAHMQGLLAVLATVSVIALSLYLLTVIPPWLFWTIVAITFGPLIRLLWCLVLSTQAQAQK